jgi:2'-5' RNA ligase
MPRLFTALWPDSAAVADLEAALVSASDWPPAGWRVILARLWHITLCFHGEADPGVLARLLEAHALGRRAPWLRLEGAVRFRGVLAAGVVPPRATPDSGSARDSDSGSDPDSNADLLRGLVAACGADPAGYRAHVTVARASRRADRTAPAGPLVAYRGPWWRPAQVCLVRSELGSGPPRYTVVHRVALDLPAGPMPDPESAAR